MCAGQYLSVDFSLLYFRYHFKYQKASEILFFKVKIFYKYLSSFPLYATFYLFLFIKKNCLIPLSSRSYKKQQHLFVSISCLLFWQLWSFILPIYQYCICFWIKVHTEVMDFLFLGLVTMEHFKLEYQRTGSIPLTGISRRHIQKYIVSVQFFLI